MSGGTSWLLSHGQLIQESSRSGGSDTLKSTLFPRKLRITAVDTMEPIKMMQITRVVNPQVTASHRYGAIISNDCPPTPPPGNQKKHKNKKQQKTGQGVVHN